MRDRGPVYQAKNSNVVVVTGFYQVSAVLKDDRYEVEALEHQRGSAGIDTDCILRQNPPRHDEVRRVMSKGFTARAIDRLEEMITKQCNELLDPVMAAGRFDVVEDYALPLALGVIAQILGVPESYRDQFRVIGKRIARLLDPFMLPDEYEEARQASADIVEYFGQLYDERRRCPGEDLLSVLTAAADTDVRVTPEEQLANAQFILVAGYETTVGMIGSGINMLLDRPDVWHEMHDDAKLVANVVEETLRIESPVQMTNRHNVEPLDLLGFEVPADSRVLAIMAAANRDPDVFPDPASFDARRENANRHLAFVVGSHHCLGSSLARLEGQIAYRTMLERMPEIRRAGPAQRRPQLVARGLTSVPVEFTRR
jgi:cytochrome P450